MNLGHFGKKIGFNTAFLLTFNFVYKILGKVRTWTLFEGIF